MSILKKNIWKPSRHENGLWERLSSWQVILLSAVLVWMVSCFPPAADVFSTFSLELGVLLVAAFAAVVFWLCRIKKNCTPEKVYSLILFGSLLLRVLAVLAIDYRETNHDVGGFFGEGELSGTGFYGYIDYICTYGRLPDFDPRTVWSFYNPPGFPLLAAGVLKVIRLLHVEEPYCYEALQCVSFLFAALTVWTMGKILGEFPIKARWKNLLLACLAFHPYFYLSAATLTNDAMSTYFAVLCVWLTVRWYRQRSWKYILLLALSLGLAMFTKINAGLVGFGIAFVFIYVFFTDRKGRKRTVPQYIAFLGVSVPLAFYYPVKNKLLYGMPLFYVQQLEQNNPLRITGVTGLDRLLFPGKQSLLIPFSAMNPEIEFNVWVETIRSSLFDERYTQDMGLANLLAIALLWLAIAAAVVMLVLLLKTVLRSKVMPFWQRGFIGIAYGSTLLSYVVFCFSEPYTCSMHYRYIAMLMLLPAICTGIWLSEEGEQHPTLVKTVDWLVRTFSILAVVMILWLMNFALLAGR